MLRSAALLPLALLAACQPPAVPRDAAQSEAFASAPQPSPATATAVWTQAANGQRIAYGQPGQPVIVALECTGDPGARRIRLTRFAPADPHAQAFAALVGAEHDARFPVDSVVQGTGHVWRGALPATSPKLAALAEPGAVELTIPGAGTTVLNPSVMPGEFIARCAGSPPAR